MVFPRWISSVFFPAPKKLESFRQSRAKNAVRLLVPTGLERLSPGGAHHERGPLTDRFHEPVRSSSMDLSDDTSRFRMPDAKRRALTSMDARVGSGSGSMFASRCQYTSQKITGQYILAVILSPFPLENLPSYMIYW
jgi:hypothetical protein